MRKIAFSWGSCPAQRIEIIMTAGGSHTATKRPQSGRMRGGRGLRHSPGQSLPLEGGAPRSESKIYMTAGGSHTSTTVVRLKPDRMRSKVTASYQLMVIVDSFDLISQPLRAASFPSRGSLNSEVWGRLRRVKAPLHAGRQRLTESLPGIRAHRGMPPPLQNFPGMLAESAFPTLPLH